MTGGAFVRCAGAGFLAVVLVLVTGEVARAQPPPAPTAADRDLPGLADTPPATRAPSDKWQYHLFRPTPAEWIREMNTDRPDKTESPYTLDAGHFQIELDVLRYTYDRRNPERAKVRLDRWEVAPMNLKVGVWNNVDLQMLLETYAVETTDIEEERSHQRRSGFGDVTMRVKVNLWGNDGGATAFAVLPFVKLPTNQDGLGNKVVEGGVALPLAVQLPLGVSLGVMTEFDFVRDDVGTGTHTEIVNSVTLGRDIVGKLAAYVEFFSQVSTKGGPWIGTLDVGVTYALTGNVQLDAGVNIGITRAAPDVNPFVGMSVRF